MGFILKNLKKSSVSLSLCCWSHLLCSLCCQAERLQLGSGGQTEPCGKTGPCLHCSQRPVGYWEATGRWRYWHYVNVNTFLYCTHWCWFWTEWLEKVLWIWQLMINEDVSTIFYSWPKKIRVGFEIIFLTVQKSHIFKRHMKCTFMSCQQLDKLTVEQITWCCLWLEICKKLSRLMMFFYLMKHLWLLRAHVLELSSAETSCYVMTEGQSHMTWVTVTYNQYNLPQPASFIPHIISPVILNCVLTSSAMLLFSSCNLHLFTPLMLNLYLGSFCLKSISHPTSSLSPSLSHTDVAVQLPDKKSIIMYVTSLFAVLPKDVSMEAIREVETLPRKFKAEAEDSGPGLSAQVKYTVWYFTCDMIQKDNMTSF